MRPVRAAAQALAGLRAWLIRPPAEATTILTRPRKAGSWWVCDGELLYLVQGRPDEIAERLTRDPHFYARASR